MTKTFPDFTGRTLNNGRYFLMNILGAGAYGKVYKALDNHSPSPVFVAVKCLLKHEPGSRHDIIQRRELALHEQVSGHPNIVRFHNTFSDDTFVYVVLDLCDGGDLFTAITEKQIFIGNNDLVRSTFLQLIDAVHECHKQDVFHRDIKPENILCSKDGTIFLADFGLSTDDHLSKDFGCGSSYYMSPG
jgi:serine/threonine protein kinase